MYFTQLRKPLLLLAMMVITLIILLAEMGAKNIPAGQAAPLAEAPACFPSGPYPELRHGNSPLADNLYGDHQLDFDGDGRTDVFTVNAQQEFEFSSGAKEPWQFLRTNLIAITDLRFGDFDADGKTDLFRSIAGFFYYSSGGVGDWQIINTSILGVSSLRIGQFDNDPRSDIFMQDNVGDWFISSGGTDPFIPTGMNANLPRTDYRFVDLDGNGKTDVFRIDASGQFLVSYDATSSWQNLLSVPGVVIDTVRFGHFDNQPGADVLVLRNGNWMYSSSGSSPLVTLRNATLPMAQLRVGDYDGNGLSDLFSIAQNNRWQVAFDVVNEPKYLVPTIQTPSGQLNCISSDTDSDQDSFSPSISSDGNKVTFASNADLLSQGNVNGFEIWLYQTQLNTFQRITNGANENAQTRNEVPQISADGNKIVFESNVDLLGQGNVSQDEIWLYDIQSGNLNRVTNGSQAGRSSITPVLDGNGRRIVFMSDADFLNQGIPAGQEEIWMYDTVLQTFTRLTTTTSPTRNHNNPHISKDGTKVVFHSDDDFLGQGIPESQYELWLYDVGTGDLTRLTFAPSGRYSKNGRLNIDGSHLVFVSDIDFNGTNVQPNQNEIWLMDVATQQVTQVSNGVADRDSDDPVISDNGQIIVFHSNADFFADGILNTQYELWRFDVPNGELSRLTYSPNRPNIFNTSPEISGNGRYVTFSSDTDFSGHGITSTDYSIWLLDTNYTPPPGSNLLYLPAVLR